jgi:hypothetical protein
MRWKDQDSNDAAPFVPSPLRAGRNSSSKILHARTTHAIMAKVTSPPGERTSMTDLNLHELIKVFLVEEKVYWQRYDPDRFVEPKLIDGADQQYFQEAND